MPVKRGLRNTTGEVLGKEAGRLLLPGWLRTLSKKRWFHVSPVFFLGTIVTAVGTTTYQSDTVIFIGMLIMGLGIVAMWIAETGMPKLKALPGPLAFISGSVLTAMSMTVNPSNPLLCGGMILTGLGTLGMWLVQEAKREFSAVIVGLLFGAGITIEAVSLTIVPSELLVMIGMIATGIGAFAMWAYETNKDSDEEEPE